MSASKARSWKILCVGRVDPRVEKAEKHLHEIGYSNTKFFPLKNDKDSDDKLIELLKQDDWDAVSIGGAIAGYNDKYPREITTLHWFNRLVNLIKENAPQAKLIFAANIDDLADSFERVLGSQEKSSETA